jgi:NDP-sugar pyrophosphorylase family protein
MTGLSTALLLTAGLGTRLRPLTLVRAKPAIPVAGVPMVERIIAWLAAAGIDDIVLNLHAAPDTITSVVGDGSQLAVRARYSWEMPQVLGSAGGPRRALDILGADTFVIVNGDTLTDLAIAPMAKAHVDSRALVTMAVIPNPDAAHYSGLRLDPDGAVLGVVPRGSSEPSFHFVGVQIAHRDAFAAAPEDRPSNSVGEVYTDLISSRPGSIRAHMCEARFWDIGTVADYWTTSHEFDPSGKAGVSKTLRLGDGAHVSDSIVWDDVAIGAGARVVGCIVTDGVRVEPGENYSNAILMRGPDGRTIATPRAVEHK